MSIAMVLLKQKCCALAPQVIKLMCMHFQHLFHGTLFAMLPPGFLTDPLSYAINHFAK